MILMVFVLLIFFLIRTLHINSYDEKGNLVKKNKKTNRNQQKYEHETE
jgi:hypothetical protein